MKKTYLLSLLITLWAMGVVKAQDPNFSQFFASPLTLNPALTGKFDGVFRVAGNYRNQWPTINNAFVTKTVSADFGILKDRISEVDQFGVGIMGMSDQSGNGILNNNSLAISMAYHKGLDENGNHQIGAGFQAGFMNKRLDVNKVYFEDQLTPLGFTGVTNEIFTQQQVNVSYIDVNAGVLYNGTSNGYNSFYLGASMYHINRPKESFKGGDYYLNPRVTIQAGGKLPVGYNNSIHVAVNHSMQAKATNTVFGAAYALNLNQDEKNPTNVYAGAWYRLNDAVIPYIGLEFSGIHLGYSYDVNTSSLKPGSNMRGGNEISLIYIKQPVNRDLKKLNCPKF